MKGQRGWWVTFKRLNCSCPAVGSSAGGCRCSRMTLKCGNCGRTMIERAPGVFACYRCKRFVLLDNAKAAPKDGSRRVG